MNAKKDMKSTLTDPRPLLAVVGATDLMVEKLREAGTKAAQDAPHLKDLEDRAVSDANAVVRGVRRLPSMALNQTLDVLVRAHEEYEDLADRGAKVVNEQRTSGLVHEAEERVTELATKATGLAQNSKGYVDEVSTKAEKYVDEVTHKAETYVDEVSHKAERYVDKATHRAGKYADEVSHTAEKYVGGWSHKADDAAHKANEAARKAALEARGRASGVLKTARTEADHLLDVVTHPTQRRAASMPKQSVATAPKPTPRRRRVSASQEGGALRPAKRTAAVTKSAAPVAGAAKQPTTPRKRVTAKVTAPATPATPEAPAVEAEVTVEAPAE